MAASVVSTNGDQGEHVPCTATKQVQEGIQHATAQASGIANTPGPPTCSQAFASCSLQLRAPRTGVLLEACARKGDFVRAGQPLVVLSTGGSEQQDGAARQAAASLTLRRNALLNERRPLRELHTSQRRMELAQIDRALAALAQECVDTACNDKLVITAPQAGVITACPVNVGQPVQGGQILLVLTPHAEPSSTLVNQSPPSPCDAEMGSKPPP